MKEERIFNKNWWTALFSFFVFMLLFGGVFIGLALGVSESVWWFVLMVASLAGMIAVYPWTMKSLLTSTAEQEKELERMIKDNA
jgi:hypothetical protein